MKTTTRIAAGFMSVLILTGCATSGAADAPAKTTTKPVTQGNLVVGLTADGAVALPVTNLNFEVEGIVGKVYASAGQDVKKGDLLGELDASDYELDIETAKNNLQKAQQNLADALWNYEYSMKSDKVSLGNTETSLSAGFDDYSYTSAVTDAQVTLKKREKELKEAQDDAKNPYSTATATENDRKLADATQAVADKKKDLADARKDAGADAFDSYSYATNLADTKATLEKREREYAEAQADVSKPNSATDYKNKIKDAEDLLYTRQLELARARKYAASPELLASSSSSDISSVSKQAQKDLTTAESNYKTAQESLDRLNEEARKAADDNMETATENLTKAKEAYETAQHNYTTAMTDHGDNGSKSVEQAQKAYDTALLTLARTKEDIARAKKDAAENANDALETAQTNYDDAKRALEKAENNLTNAKENYDTDTQKTKSEYELKLQSYQHSQSGSVSVLNAEIALKDAQLALKDANNKLEKTKVYASIDGQVISVNNKEGEKITASTNSGGFMFGTSSSSNSFITICDKSAIYLSSAVPEGDIVGVEAGQVVNVTIDSIGDTVYKGKVETVSSLPSTDSTGITTYAVTVKLDSVDSVIKDGMAALLQFVRLEHENVLMIPNKAVFLEDGKQYVNVEVAENKYEKREVSCGLTNGTETEVLSGLSAGESVVVGAIASENTKNTGAKSAGAPNAGTNKTVKEAA